MEYVGTINKLIDILTTTFSKQDKRLYYRQHSFLKLHTAKIEWGKQAISFCIDKYPDTLHRRFNKKFIIDLNFQVNCFNPLSFLPEYFNWTAGEEARRQLHKNVESNIE